MRATTSTRKSPRGWKPKKGLDQRITRFLKFSGMTFSELCEIGVTHTLNKAETPKGLIDLKLAYLAEKNGEAIK